MGPIRVVKWLNLCILVNSIVKYVINVSRFFINDHFFLFLLIQSFKQISFGIFRTVSPVTQRRTHDTNIVR